MFDFPIIDRKMGSDLKGRAGVMGICEKYDCLNVGEVWLNTVSVLAIIYLIFV